MKVGHPFLTWPFSMKTITNYRHPHHFAKVGHPFLTWPCIAPCTPCWRAACLGPGSDSRALRAGLVEYYSEWSKSFRGVVGPCVPLSSLSLGLKVMDCPSLQIIQFLSPSGDLGISLVWDNNRTGPTFWSDCWNPLQSELNYLWGVLSCSQDDIRWF